MKCRIEGCEKLAAILSLCRRHYDQITKMGFVYGNARRSNRGQNDYQIIENICVIDLCNIRSEKVAETKIDLDDFERVIKFKWGTRKGYAVHHEGRTIIGLANFIMNFKSGKDFMIDHINQDKLDNRKQNLRIVNKAQNNFNRGLQRNNTSGHRGVYWDKRHQVWEVHFKDQYIGITKNKIQAIEMRRQAEEDDENITR